MKTYNVHIYRVMRLFFPGITAITPEVAAQLAAERPTPDAECIDDCDGETLAAFVDVVGDEDCSQSRVISLDPLRDAAPEMLKALDMAANFMGDDLSDDPTENRVYETLLAAIAQAQGTEPDIGRVASTAALPYTSL